jgi:hypothetical protein
VGLRALAGPAPVLSFLTSTSASQPAAAATSRASGRACRPWRLRTSTRTSTRASA